MSIFFLIIQCFHLYIDCLFTGHTVDNNKMEFGEGGGGLNLSGSGTDQCQNFMDMIMNLYIP